MLSMHKTLVRGVVSLSLVAVLLAPSVSEAWTNFQNPITFGFQQGQVLGATSLTEAQIQAILSLLQSFGADPLTVARVERALRGNTPPPPSAFGGALTLSVSATPGSQTVVPGTPRFTVVNIQADATGSSEDVAVPGLMVTYADNAPSDPISCIAYTQANVLSAGNIINPNNVGSAPQSYTVLFDAPLIVPRGTVQVISFSCVIPGSATAGSFRFGLSSGNSFMAKGSTSGENITPRVITNYGPLVSISTTASALSVRTSEKSDSYRIVAAGTQQVPVGAYHFQALSEPVRLQKLGLKLTSGTANDLVRVTLWRNDTTQVGEAYFTGNQTTATATLTQPVIIAANSGEGLTIKADLSPIGKAQPVGESGHLIKIDFLNAEAVGNNSGANVAVTGSTNVAGVRVMKSFPTVTLDTLPSTGVQDGRLMRFKVTADTHGPVSLGQLNFSIAVTGSGTVNGQADLYAYTDPSYSSPVSGFGPAGALGGASVPYNNASMLYKFSSPLQIQAGGTRYFELRDSTKGTGIVNGATAVTTTLHGDKEFYSALFPFAYVSNNFMWSPNSLGTSLFSDSDWTNGYGVSGLPASGLMQTRSGSVSSTSPDLVPIINAFTASPTTVASGQAVTFSWNVSNVQQGGCYLWSSLLPGQTITSSNNWGGVGSFVLTPVSSATYTLWCASSWKDSSPSAQRSIPITVTASSAPTTTPPAPQTASFTNPTTFTTAQPALWGNASGVGSVKVVVNLYNGDIIYTGGTVPVSNGTWAHTVGTSLPNGNFTAYLYGPSNNQLAVQNFTVNVPQPPQVADLSSGSVSVFSGAPVYAGSVSPVFGTTVSNYGSAQTQNPFTITYKIDSDSDHGWYMATASEGNVTLGAGTSYQSGVNYVFPNPGTWYVQACADSTNVNTESNESNNCGPWSTLTVYPVPSTSSGGGTSGGRNLEAY